MATKKEIDRHLKDALKEIGEIKPWFDKKLGEWIFSHSLYPVEYGGHSAQEVIDNYPKYLREFILHRLDGRLEALEEKKTKGRGGKRLGAGRPKSIKKTSPTKIVRLKTPVADWVKANEEKLVNCLSTHKEELTEYIEQKKQIRAAAYRKNLSKKRSNDC